MKKTYIIPESMVLNVAPMQHIAAGSEPNVKVDPTDAGINPEDFQSKEGGDFEGDWED